MELSLETVPERGSSNALRLTPFCAGADIHLPANLTTSWASPAAVLLPWAGRPKHYVDAATAARWEVRAALCSGSYE